MSLVDLSHPIRAAVPTYLGFPAPKVKDHLSFDASHARYDEGTEFRIAQVQLMTSTGTYLDAPAHRYRDGADVASVPLERCAALPAVVLDVRGQTEIRGEVVPDAVAGCAVLFRTGWDSHWETQRYGSPEHPHLSPAAADRLVEAGAVLVGVDSVNVDGTVDGARPIHSTLLAGGVLIVENLTGLDQLPARGATFTAVPVAFERLPSWPVRAYAVL